MAAIALYAGKMNQYSGLLQENGRAVKSISSAFPRLKRFSGRGSYGAAYQMVLTKLKNNTYKRITLKTLRNGFVSEMWGGLFGIFFGELFENTVKQIRTAI